MQLRNSPHIIMLVLVGLGLEACDGKISFNSTDSNSTSTTSTSTSSGTFSVSSGGSVSLSMPVNSTTLTAIALNAKGSVNFSWSKISGGISVMAGQNAANLHLSHLSVGSYQFQVSATDNGSGATATNVVSLTVSGTVGANGGQQVKCVKADSGCHFAYGYLEYLPLGYHLDSTKSWPLIVFLHGLGEVGDGSSLGLDEIDDGGIPKYIATQGKHYPAIVISPQTSNNWGNTNGVHNLMTHLIGKYRVDTNRIYVTGLSLGGIGTLFYLLAQPSVVAAAVPISGQNQSPNAICGAVNNPVWAFHNNGDTTVAASGTTSFINTLNACNSPARSTPALMTIYNSTAHNAWDPAYSTASLWDWMFAQHL
jgi:hypothetical protein